MIITDFRLFENKDELSIIIDKLYKEYKDSKTDEEKDKIIRKILRESVMKGNPLREWFNKFRGERKVMIELKKRKMK